MRRTRIGRTRRAGASQGSRTGRRATAPSAARRGARPRCTDRTGRPPGLSGSHEGTRGTEASSRAVREVGHEVPSSHCVCATSASLADLCALGPPPWSWRSSPDTCCSTPPARPERRPPLRPLPASSDRASRRPDRHRPLHPRLAERRTPVPPPTTARPPAGAPARRPAPRLHRQPLRLRPAAPLPRPARPAARSSALNYSPLTCDIRTAAELLGRHIEEICERTGQRRGRHRRAQPRRPDRPVLRAAARRRPPRPDARHARHPALRHPGRPAGGRAPDRPPDAPRLAACSRSCAGPRPAAVRTS